MSRAAKQFIPKRIVSGGQTGVDRSGLEAAIALGIEHGGWCPRGRLSEDGTIPSRYDLDEHESSDYKKRTRQNVLDSDATLILFEGKLQGGTRLTQRYAVEAGKPCLAIRIDKAVEASDLFKWLNEHRPGTLNIAGPRESNYPGIEERGFEVLMDMLTTAMSE